MHESRSVVMMVAIGLTLLAGCSQERQAWRSAEAADSIESYGEFLRKHPESELAARARERVVQLEEERDWQETGTLDTLEAYQLFLTRHPQGKWADEARIRIESFAVAEPPSARAPAAQAPRSDPGLSSDKGPPASSVVAAPAGPPTAAVRKPPATVSAAAPAPAAGPGRRSGVQLGAFSDEKRAQREWQRLVARFPGELGALQPRFHAAQTSSGPLVRLQVETPDERQARSLCATLRKAGQGCVVVLPGQR